MFVSGVCWLERKNKTAHFIDSGKTSQNNGRVIMIGPFPPPVYGLALCNAAMWCFFKDIGVEPIMIDLSAKTLNRALYARISRAPKVFLSLLRFLKLRPESRDIFYLSLSGGYGQIYDILFSVLARLGGAQIFFHHHSYAYITKPNKMTGLLISIAGEKATHIVVCDDMAERLAHFYHSAGNTFVLSNAAVIRMYCQPIQLHRQALKKIGFLGNISSSKGIFEFLEVMRVLSKDSPGTGIKGMIAGPFEDEFVEKKVRAITKDLANVFYVGPKYGEEKVRFLSEIDVLLFPTKYSDEADPLTIHEALSFGLPVIAWQRGCIESVLDNEGGLVIKQTDNFVKLAVERLLMWNSSGTEYRRASTSAYERSLFLSVHYQKKIHFLFSKMFVWDDRFNNYYGTELPGD
jgi:glycosyltransferase involved in cell wall biosynthesis